jgi:hypothetical protein
VGLIETQIKETKNSLLENERNDSPYLYQWSWYWLPKKVKAPALKLQNTWWEWDNFRIDSLQNAVDSKQFVYNEDHIPVLRIDAKWKTWKGGIPELKPDHFTVDLLEKPMHFTEPYGDIVEIISSETYAADNDMDEIIRTTYKEISEQDVCDSGSTPTIVVTLFPCCWE